MSEVYVEAAMFVCFLIKATLSLCIEYILVETLFFNGWRRSGSDRL